MSFNPAQKKVSPEEVLRKTKQLLTSGKKKLAVDELQSWLVSKRRFQWEDEFETVANLYVDLSVGELKSCKDGMVSFRNMTQQNKPATLERLLRRCINAAQKKGDKMADQLEKDLMRQKRKIFDDFVSEQQQKLEETKEEDPSLLSSSSASSTSPLLSNKILKRNRELRRRLEECENEWHLQQFENETLNFQWCCYLDVLFIIRNNGKLNHVFIDTAIKAARYCQRLKRTNELRVLFDTVRKRYYHLVNNQGFEYALKLSDPGVVNELIGMRVYLLQIQLILGMYSETYRSIKDLLEIINAVKTDGCLVPGTNASTVTIDPYLLSIFYKQCSHVFWLCQRYLLHAYSLYYSYLNYAKWVKGGAMPPMVNIPSQTPKSDDADEFEEIVPDSSAANSKDDDSKSAEPSKASLTPGRRIGPLSHIKFGTANESAEVAFGGYSTALPQALPPYPCVTPTNTDLLFLGRLNEKSSDTATQSVKGSDDSSAATSKNSELYTASQWLNQYNGFVCFDLNKEERKIYLQKKLNQTMLAALIVPPLNRTKSQELMLSGDSALERMFKDFGFEEHGTRDSLIDMLLREKDLPQVSRRLYCLIELENSPVNFTMKFRRLLEEMMKVSPDGYKEQSGGSSKRVTSIARTNDSKLRSQDGLMYSIRILYQNFISQLAVLRLLDRLSRVYTSISWDRFLTYMSSLRLIADSKSQEIKDYSPNTIRDDLVKRTMTGLNGLSSGGSYKESLEKIIVSCIRDSGSLNVAVRLDDSQNLIVFGDESGWSMGIGDNSKNGYGNRNSKSNKAYNVDGDPMSNVSNNHDNGKGLTDELVMVCNKFDEIAAKLVKKNFTEINEQRENVFATIRETVKDDHTLIVGRFDESDRQQNDLYQWKADKVKKAKHEEKVEEMKKIAERKQAEQKAEEVRKKEEYQQKLKERRQMHTKKVIESVKKSAIIENAAAVVINSSNVDKKKNRPLSAVVAGRDGSSLLLPPSSGVSGGSSGKSVSSTAAWKSQKVWSTKETKSLLKESQAVKKVQETVQSKSMRLKQLVGRAKRGEILSETDLAELHTLQWELENSMRREKKERLKQERRQYDYFVRAQRKHLETKLTERVDSLNKKAVKKMKPVFKAQREKERKQWEADRNKKDKLERVLSFMGEFEDKLALELNTRKEAKARREKAAADAQRRKQEERKLQAERSKRKEEKRQKRMEKERIARERARQDGIKFDESMVQMSDDDDRESEDDYDQDASDGAVTGAELSKKSTTVVEAGSKVKYTSREALFSKLGMNYGGSSSSSTSRKKGGGGSRFPSSGPSSGSKIKTRNSPSPPPPSRSAAPARSRRNMDDTSGSPPKKAAYRPPKEVAPPPAKRKFRPSREAVSYDPNAPSSIRGTSAASSAMSGGSALRPASLSRPTAPVMARPSDPRSASGFPSGGGRMDKRDFGRPSSDFPSQKKEKKASKFGSRFARDT